MAKAKTMPAATAIAPVRIPRARVLCISVLPVEQPTRDGRGSDIHAAADKRLESLHPAPDVGREELVPIYLDGQPDALGLEGHQAPERRHCAVQVAAHAASVEGVSAHSGRVGHASELTARGASTTEVMLSGGWKTARMVAHYSAGAKAERGAVAKYL